MITKLQKDEVFVFGSNLAGRHGKGAALQAVKWGAKYGQGQGRHGATYAIPTKDRNIKTLPLSFIAIHVTAFLKYAALHPELRFLVTEIGCGLAGYSSSQIAPMFIGAPSNVILPEAFCE